MGTQIQIRLDNPAYNCPGDILIGEYQIRPGPGFDIAAIEISVLWATEGKGQADIGVHFFERKRSPASQSYRGSHKISTVLPATPLSYQGRILKVDWYVRVSLFATDGRTVIEDHPFQLGPGCYFEQPDPRASEQEIDDEESP